MNKKIIPTLLMTGILVAGCNQPAPDTTATTPAPATVAPAPAPAVANVAKEDAVAIVNGTAISKATFKTLEDEIAVRSHGQKFPKQQLLEELIQRELLVQDAQKKHLDQSSEVKERIQMAERSLLSQADLQDYLKTSPITDADLKAAYDKEVAGMSGLEYKARHILVKTEEEGKKLIAELTKGAKFEELAKNNSLDLSNKDKGGDLGWFTDGQMVEPFTKAVAGLEKGKFTQTPVQTQFGWHVILREDSRTQTPLAFEAVKEQLRPALQQQKVQAMLESLRKQAKVEILMPLEEPKPAATPEAVTAPVTPATPAEANKPADSTTKTDPTAAPASNEPASTANAPIAAEATKTEPVKPEVATQPVDPTKK